MRTKNKKLNVRLVRKIQKHILEEPRRFFMSWFIVKKEWSAGDSFASDNDTRQKFGPCGTAACIAGWANLLTNGRDASDFKRAATLLGIENPGDYYASAFVFDIPQWPDQFRLPYGKAKTPKLRAKIAAERLDYLIKTGE